MSIKEDNLIKIKILNQELSLQQAKDIYQQLNELFQFMPKTIDLNKYKEENQQNKKHNLDNSNRPINEVFFKENQTSKMSYN